ncbi:MULTISPECIES: hypothetical protein [Bacillus]|uniref:hypothetical protein n=1 Tax=Bacillus TaxID=1386 RepID=UPI001C23E821|nr:hypothetical protein [Bacillus pumilus]MBU8607847.1 hypothetical protein [Bacillus pumilus]
MGDNEYIYNKAMEEATKVLGADPAYFGEEGNTEVERQLIKLGVSLEDFKKQVTFYEMR